jgi:dTDP-4-dehydrorhamnose 3,5-epimerase
MGLLHLSTKRFLDSRGYVSETYSHQKYSCEGVKEIFVHDTISCSANKSTLRGLHFQAPPHAQAKLVRCGRGAIFDVAVDIRRGSPTYGQWKGYELTAEYGDQLYIPVGFAHGFVTLEPDSEIVYKCSDYYAPETEGAVLWNDPNIGIDWPTAADPILSDKDAVAPLFSDLDSPFIFCENS